MKKMINKIFSFLAVLVLLTACDWEPIKFDSSKSFVAFISASNNMSEVGTVSAVVVKVSALLGSPALTVTFDFDTTGLDNPAVEGVDYTLLNSSKTLSFPDGWGYDTIWIESIDNDIFTGDKSFSIVLTANSADYQFGSQQAHIVGLLDNEHPLGKWIGTYDVLADSYGDVIEGEPEHDWDEEWTVVTNSVSGDVNKLSLTGIAFGSEAVIATIDMENMTITIPAGSSTGEGYGYGPCVIWYSDYGTFLEESDVVGTISEDGSIHIDHMAMILTDYDNYLWDAFNTTWTKQSRKSAAVDVAEKTVSKHVNLK